ncbi:MAG: hypothetical protein FWF83_07965, partial [Clostridiales bacterium]|nr:hypothetical protein [Clostridiales bacterium]
TATDGQCHPPGIELLRLLTTSKPDLVVLDPSSKGAKQVVLDAILAAAPARIVYVSCDPATLARDLRVLIGDGAYTISRIQPVDLFPQTAHIETVVSLIR